MSTRQPHFKSKEYYTLEEVKNEMIGELGTPERDKFEAKIKAGLIGNAIRYEREAQKLSRKDVEDKLQLASGTISRIENGETVSLQTIIYVISCLGIDATLDLGRRGLLNLKTKPQLTMLGMAYASKEIDIPKSLFEKLDMKTFEVGMSISQYINQLLEQDLGEQ